ncbi:MAG: NACHT domain-containing protein [Oscillatoriophycideae cyanobacterium NC_groundwater_1537_Pr4_S-0.65um_50_18]|nr:NACHT domain-containing protein [Oscillatoriophycideae cyanobacterium NC_groundwater_1537_Pr4_S-0.65um_50_18]
MERSRKLILTSWTQANNALNTRFEGNKSKLADHVKMSRTTVTNFFGEKPVRESEFRKICLALGLNWERVSAVEASGNRPSTQIQPQDDLFQQVKERCRQKILTQHSQMRLLSGEEIGVDQLYVDVWLLNRSPRTYQVSQAKLLETFDLRNDRLGLGDRIKRNPGFEVANANPKLVILGKPGSGKTTFLKHLAVDWCKGEFQPDSIAVLIELRRIRDGKWELLDAIGKELNLKDQQQVGALLEAGKLLVLMDGLDEVSTSRLRQIVQNQIQQIAEDYPNNRFILTCRTQIITSIPDGFTSVEVADFSTGQIKQFVRNWFTANGKSDVEAAEQWKAFESTVSRNPALNELTATPVLLSLMCLVLQDEGAMPPQVNWLYEKAIKLLLSKWNDAKQIEGWEVGSQIYGELNIEQKEALLVDIAARKFENLENFVLFKQQELVVQIDTFLQRTRFNEETAKSLQLANSQESLAVLKTIEAQHGLLIERADELWSFSHLTFQEHFTLRWLNQLPAEQLADKIASQQWQERVKQLVKSQQPADRLVRLIKQAIDQSIAKEPTLQTILVWVLEKSEFVRAHYRPAAIRACYFALDLERAFDRDRAFDLDLDHALELARALDRTLNRTLDCALDLDLDLALTFDRARTLARNRDLALDRTFDLDCDRARAFALDRAFDRALALALARDSELKNKLDQLRRTLVQSYADGRDFQQWWQANGTEWTRQLRQVMIQHRNIGHNWNLTNDLKRQLQSYYNANRFLVELIKIEGAVSNSVRAEIEDSLLLPWEELQRRHPETYGQSSSP